MGKGVIMPAALGLYLLVRGDESQLSEIKDRTEAVEDAVPLLHPNDQTIALELVGETVVNDEALVVFAQSVLDFGLTTRVSRDLSYDGQNDSVAVRDVSTTTLEDMARGLNKIRTSDSLLISFLLEHARKAAAMVAFRDDEIHTLRTEARVVAVATVNG